MSNWSNKDMHHHACQLLWQEVCSHFNAYIASSLCGLESLWRLKMLLNMGRRDILRHKSNSKITVWVWLWCSTMWGHFLASLEIACHFGPNMLWRALLKIIWLEDRFSWWLYVLQPPHSLQAKGFFLGICLLLLNYTDLWGRFLEKA